MYSCGRIVAQSFFNEVQPMKPREEEHVKDNGVFHNHAGNLMFPQKTRVNVSKPPFSFFILQWVGDLSNHWRSSQLQHRTVQPISRRSPKQTQKTIIVRNTVLYRIIAFYEDIASHQRHKASRRNGFWYSWRLRVGSSQSSVWRKLLWSVIK